MSACKSTDESTGGATDALTSPACTFTYNDPDVTGLNMCLKYKTNAGLTQSSVTASCSEFSGVLSSTCPAQNQVIRCTTMTDPDMAIVEEMGLYSPYPNLWGAQELRDFCTLLGGTPEG